MGGGPDGLTGKVHDIASNVLRIEESNVATRENLSQKVDNLERDLIRRTSEDLAKIRSSIELLKETDEDTRRRLRNSATYFIRLKREVDALRPPS